MVLLAVVLRRKDANAGYRPGHTYIGNIQKLVGNRHTGHLLRT
ncbi:hypothetical protein SDC9_86643 [bioreactor metagenome]|uniref:Uncharacterized protein n=1 Tax=bioreactor metagenome TaxID=1076179 RepID=A0A644ZGI6_9ZZZZ